MKRSYFEKYLEIAPLSHALWRSQEAKALEKTRVKKPVLDIGCGFGEFAGVFFNKMVEVGVDISKNDLVEAAKKKKYKELIWADAKSLPFRDNSFNSVVSISTLEHIPEVERCFPEAYRVLKKGGFLIITLPTIELNRKLKMPKFLRLLRLEKFARLYLKIYHNVFKHRVIISKKNWEKMITRAGFKILSTKGTLSDNQIIIYESFLLSAAPTQVFRKVFNKRLPISLKLRVKLLKNIFSKIDHEPPSNEANIMIIAQK